MFLLDRLLASEAERRNAISRADEAVRIHGEAAVSVLERKLADPRRHRSKRTLRLAIDRVMRIRAAR